jgi:hypothetical protein
MDALGSSCSKHQLPGNGLDTLAADMGRAEGLRRCRPLLLLLHREASAKKPLRRAKASTACFLRHASC